MAGRDVHQTGTGAVVHKHVPGEQLAGAIAERVVVLKLLQLIPLHRAQNLEVPAQPHFSTTVSSSGTLTSSASSPTRMSW